MNLDEQIRTYAADLFGQYDLEQPLGAQHERLPGPANKKAGVSRRAVLLLGVAAALLAVVVVNTRAPWGPSNDSVAIVTESTASDDRPTDSNTASDATVGDVEERPVPAPTALVAKQPATPEVTSEAGSQATPEEAPEPEEAAPEPIDQPTDGVGIERSAEHAPDALMLDREGQVWLVTSDGIEPIQDVSSILPPPSDEGPPSFVESITWFQSETLVLSVCCEPASGELALADPASEPESLRRNGLRLALSPDLKWAAYTDVVGVHIVPAQAVLDDDFDSEHRFWPGLQGTGIADLVWLDDETIAVSQFNYSTETTRIVMLDRNADLLTEVTSSGYLSSPVRLTSGHLGLAAGCCAPNPEADVREESSSVSTLRVYDTSLAILEEIAMSIEVRAMSASKGWIAAIDSNGESWLIDLQSGIHELVADNGRDIVFVGS